MMRTGVSFQAEASAGTQSGGRPHSRLLPNDDISEKKIDFNDLAERNQFVERIFWPVGTVVNTVLKYWRVPWDLLPGITAIPFQTYIYFRGFVDVHFTLQSQSSQSGTIIVYFVPSLEFDVTDRHITGDHVS
jgi:hypothetical protein